MDTLLDKEYVKFLAIIHVTILSFRYSNEISYMKGVGT